MGIKVKHSGNFGDIIYSLSAVRKLSLDRDEPIEYLFHLDQPSTYKKGQHPLGEVMLNRTMYELAKPLLESQDYIMRVGEYEGECDYDLDKFRTDCKQLSGGDIKLWYSVSYPELKPYTQTQCLYVEPIESDCVIINRTTRYNNPLIDYRILLDLKKEILFVGVENEYKIMKAIMPEVRHLVVKDFLELARHIAGCYLFVGNQSMAFAIAEQLKVKRILEQYIYAPNVIPQGGDWSVFHIQEQFKKLINELRDIT